MSETLSQTIAVEATHDVSALLRNPPGARACLVLAHGAGPDGSSFMAAVANGLAARHVATLRYQFPFMELGSKRPDRPALAQATVRAAVRTAADLMPSLPLFAGGKSFGGRMTSQAQAQAPLPSVRGLVFFGFPLHPAKKPSTDRAEHLAGVSIPMLFLQGTHDALADTTLLVPLIAELGDRATPVMVAEADHSFHVPRRSGRTDAEVLDSLLDELASWMGRH